VKIRGGNKSIAMAMEGMLEEHCFEGLAKDHGGFLTLLAITSCVHDVR
jgi:hypothetical protein